MIRQFLRAAVLALACAPTLHAQIIGARVRAPQPSAWVSLGIGWLQQQGFCDANSGACWDFGSAPQWRATLEKPLGNGGTTIGVSGTTARVPLIYDGGLGANSCVRCDADANVSQLLALLSMSGGSGFHQVIDLSAGMTMFSNFRSTSGIRLGTGKTSKDFTFAVAYGFGYGFTPRAQVLFESEYALQILPRQEGSVNNQAQQYTLRLGARYGLGGR